MKNNPSPIPSPIRPMADALREQGQRLTPQRLAILKTMCASPDAHFSAEQIYERVRMDYPTTSLATVYKTLAVLKEAGQVMELGFSDDCNRYDLVTRPHAHLVCVSCKSILDLPLEQGEEWLRQVVSTYGYSLLSQRLDVFGLCPSCQKSAAEARQNQMKTISGGSHVK